MNGRQTLMEVKGGRLVVCGGAGVCASAGAAASASSARAAQGVLLMLEIKLSVSAEGEEGLGEGVNA